MNLMAMSKYAAFSLTALALVACGAEVPGSAEVAGGEEISDSEGNPMEVLHEEGDDVRSTQQALSGGYASSAAGAAIYSKNWWYYTYFPVLGSPGSSTVTSVSWNWSLSSYPSGLIAYLCHPIKGCLDVTRYGSASSTAFSGAAANQQFFLAYKVVGTGTMSPVYGRSDQIIVNYR